ncbi:hypothetical protein EV700_3135 [Fluviicoccus keumensis]|uniref:Tetratricopeptide repeat protein n=1 Tax=Fluviicoccus keumensis TaxID=1435465 RepID=A0A4Q7YHD0_9GAMM|nr:hypothetical protein [Fluviicoccus keumensis]RZU36922.1 hypothetical protein EV700_3135 [Fluviicoccus keumensis]
MRRLTGLCLLTLSLQVAQAAEAVNPEKIFNTYSMQDFCLDLPALLESKDNDRMDERVSVVQVMDEIQQHLPARATAELANPIVRQRWRMQLRHGFFANIRARTGQWYLAGYKPLPDNRAECTLINDGFLERGELFYAVRMTLAQVGDGIGMIEMRDSMTNQPFSRVMGSFFAILMPAMLGGDTAAEGYNLPWQRASTTPPASSGRGIPEMLAAFARADNKQLINVFENTLSPEGRRQTTFQQNYLRAAEGNPGKYREALGLVIENRPANEPTAYRLQLHSIDQNCPEMLKAIDQLETAWGYHPGMDVLRLHCHEQMQDADAVRRVFLHALDTDDGYSMLYWRMMHYYAAAHRDEEALLMADILYRRFDYRLDKLDQDASLQAFARSAAFRQWLKRTETAAGVSH